MRELSGAGLTVAHRHRGWTLVGSCVPPSARQIGCGGGFAALGADRRRVAGVSDL